MSLPPPQPPTIARVVVDLALDREFDYSVPEALRTAVRVGSRVTVPFGRRQARGYVVAFADATRHPHLKAIAGVVGDAPLIDESVITLARWVGEYYCAPVEQAIRAALPAAVRAEDARYKEALLVEACPDKLTQALVESLRKRSPKQAAAAEAVLRDGSVLLSGLTAGGTIPAAAVRALEAKGAVTIRPQRVRRDPEGRRELLPAEALELMPEQAVALATVQTSIETLQPPVVLLHGVTGSGKTEVYLRAIAQVLARDGGAIVLVPEISLTPQTVERFRSRFGDIVAVLHSHLSEGERHDEWHRVHSGEARVVIGARSAVFAPVRNLGLIVVDEEHESSYKQEETPRYHARDVAVMRGHLQKCAVLLGSATPSLESFRNAQSGKYGLAVLTNRVDHRRMPVVRVVDMRVEAQRTGKPSVFSRALVEAMSARLARAEQTMLFLNRRGYASSLVCPKCGFVAKCSECSISKTYHLTDDSLRCHICGAAGPAPKACPECHDPAFRMAGIGTQRVETIVAKLFPKARIQRMDADATARKGSHHRILGDFLTGKIDILVGTQMIAKGLHFPNVTLIGVIHADMSLHVPDFRAGERTFQLLTQVAGRAGRGDVSGEVIVQTYTPFHPAVQAARQLDFAMFFDQEIEFRRELQYPPFTHLVCVTLRSRSEARGAFFAEALMKALRPGLSERIIAGEPAPAPLAKAKGFFRTQLILRGPSVRALSAALRAALAKTPLPADVSCTIDVDAASLR